MMIQNLIFSAAAFILGYTVATQNREQYLACQYQAGLKLGYSNAIDRSIVTAKAAFKKLDNARVIRSRNPESRGETITISYEIAEM